MDWEIILSAAVASIGVIEYVKGFFPETKSKVWRLLQPALCVGFSAVALLLPSWVMMGILALSISQIGYEAIIEAVKKRIGGK
jgi:hypothetical protein